MLLMISVTARLETHLGTTIEGHRCSKLTLLQVLDPNSDYEAQVKAKSDFGESDWSPSGLGTTSAPSARTGSGEVGEVVSTGTEGTGSLITLLVLSDSDDTGLEVDAKALLVASAAGTVGTSFFYADSDRGGTDEPLDGELGLGANDVLISGFRHRTQTLLQLNDNDNPVALDIGDYFSTGGAGNDLTIYLQTLADGEVSFSASAAFSRAGQVRFTLPSDAQDLLDNLAIGDRWIFKAARPAATAQTGTGEFGNITSSGIEGTGEAQTVTQSGAGESGEVTPAGIEGVGQAIPVVTHTGAGEAGTVTTAGVEGVGLSFLPPSYIEQLFNLGDFNGNAGWSGQYS